MAKFVSLAARHRKLAREWHRQKNGELAPRDIAADSSKKVWWQCSADASHVWRGSVSARTKQGSRCPHCPGIVATPTTCLEAICPDVAREWHPKRNGKLTAGALTARSGKRVWWRTQATSGMRLSRRGPGLARAAPFAPAAPPRRRRRSRRCIRRSRRSGIRREMATSRRLACAPDLPGSRGGVARRNTSGRRPSCSEPAPDPDARCARRSRSRWAGVSRRSQKNGTARRTAR